MLGNDSPNRSSSLGKNPSLPITPLRRTFLSGEFGKVARAVVVPQPVFGAAAIGEVILERRLGIEDCRGGKLHGELIWDRPGLDLAQAAGKISRQFGENVLTTLIYSTIPAGNRSSGTSSSLGLVEGSLNCSAWSHYTVLAYPNLHVLPCSTTTPGMRVRIPATSDSGNFPDVVTLPRSHDVHYVF